MLAKNAVQNPEILKPGTRDETKSIINALITSRKNPNVMNVNGIVSQITTGLIRALAMPSSTAEYVNDDALENFKPWNITLASQSEIAVTPQ